MCYNQIHVIMQCVIKGLYICTFFPYFDINSNFIIYCKVTLGQQGLTGNKRNLFCYFGTPKKL